MFLPARIGLAATLVVAVAGLAASAGAAAPRELTASATTVKAPKNGEYFHATASLHVSGKSLQIVALRFVCGSEGAPSFAGTALNDVRLKHSSKGYRFSIKANGNVSYSDGYPDENAAIGFSGRFSKSGKRAMGRFRVKPPRCADSGEMEFTAAKR